MSLGRHGDSDKLREGLQRRSSYRPLRAGHIRIIALQPGCLHDPLLADLQIRPLETSVRDHEANTELGYEAVSYCWGDLNLSRNLTTLNGPAIPITDSLYAALHSFRYENATRYLWADAACINQEDIDERASQVAMMGDIFAEADRVLVWLGPARQGTEVLAFTVLSAAINAEGTRSRRELLSLLEQHLRIARSCACCGHIVDQDLPISIDAGLSAVAKLLECSWFERLWVVQEVALAAKVEVYCGTHHADWKIFTELARVPGQYEIKDENLNAHSSNTLPRASLRQVWARMNYLNQLRARNRTKHEMKDSFRPTALCKDLLMLSHLQCRNPHDRIYGVSRVLGLEGVASLKPDYIIPVAELYRRVTELFLTSPANREGGRASVMLSLAGTESASEEHHNRPSWVPDLQHFSERSRAKHTLYQWTFAARWLYGNYLMFRCRTATDDPDEMHVRGRPFGAIEMLLDGSACPSKHVHRRSHAKCSTEEGTSLLRWRERCCIFLEQHLQPRVTNQNDIYREGIYRESIKEVFACGASSQAAEASPELDMDLLQQWIHETPQTRHSSDIEEVADDLRRYVTGYPHDREQFLCMVRTDFGLRAGWVPPNARLGDTVWHFGGAPYPFLLRSNGNSTHRLLGDALVAGVEESDILEFNKAAWSVLLQKLSNAEAELKSWLDSDNRAQLKRAADEQAFRELRETDIKMKQQHQSLVQQVQRTYAEADELLDWVRLR